MAEGGVSPGEVTGRHRGGIWAQEDPDPDELAVAWALRVAMDGPEPDSQRQRLIDSLFVVLAQRDQARAWARAEFHRDWYEDTPHEHPPAGCSRPGDSLVRLRCRCRGSDAPVAHCRIVIGLDVAVL